jgi:uncharacterized membrane protein
MSTVEDLSPDEKRAYELITSWDGLLQSELWKALDANSRKGSRLATSLEEKGFIEREQTTSNGQRTYLLKPTNGHAPDSVPTEIESEGTEETPGDETGDALDSREERALSLINDRGGIYQSEFWKELDVSSRTGSRIATSLEEQGLIRREETTHNGRRTHLLLPAKKELDFSLLMAGDMISPLVGNEEEINPIHSEEFTQWILQLAREP